MAAPHQDTFTQLPPELTELILRRLPLESLRDLRSCTWSIGAVPVDGLLKGLEIPLGELNLGSRQSTRGDRLRAMTGLTYLKLDSGLGHELDPDDDTLDFESGQQQAAVELQILLSEHVTRMPLLTSLDITSVPLSSIASATAQLHVSCPALTNLGSLYGSREWGDLWSALAGARSLRRLEIVDFAVQAGRSFGGIGRLNQLQSLVLKPRYFYGDEILLQVSRLVRLTQVRTP